MTYGRYRTNLRVHSKQPPSEKEYQDWLDSLPQTPQLKRSNMTGRRLRRIVILRREGASITDAGRAVGLTTAHYWLSKLPPELQP